MDIELISFPLNDTPYTATEFRLWSATRTNGVYSNDTHFTVTPVPDQPMRVLVSPGIAWMKIADFEGIVTANKQTQTLNLATADPDFTRIDRIVIRYDVALNKTVVTVKTGVPSPSPAAPALQRDVEAWELGIADITITPDTVMLTPASISDTRLDESLCGIMRDGVTGIPTQSLYDEFRSWLSNVQSQLSGDVAANLLALIQDLERHTAFVYYCTGVDDDLVIENIVNNFFSSGTDMAMKLIISGTMGLRTTLDPVINSSAGVHIHINHENTRDAVCSLDFSNCHVPEITVNNRSFLHISSLTARLDVTGLNVTTRAYAVYFGNDSFVGGNNNTFTNCTLTGGQGGVNINGGNNNTFTDCTMSGIYVGSDSSGNVFNNCISIGSSGANLASASNNFFTNCVLTGYTYAGVYTHAESKGSNFFIGCSIVCKSGNNYGVSVGTTAGASGSPLTFVGCKIVGGASGVRVAASSTGTEIKLIGCSIKGTSTQDVQQTTAANTVKWYIMGNSFSRASIIADGTTAITYKTSSSIYMPQYANQFSRTIE